MSQPAQRPLSLQLALLTAGLLGVGAIVLPVAWVAGGFASVVAALNAWFVAFAAAMSALIVTARLKRQQNVLPAVLGGMLIRMTLPLTAAIFVDLNFPALVASGWLGYLVVFYLAALALETWLALPQLASAAASPTLRTNPPLKHQMRNG